VARKNPRIIMLAGLGSLRATGSLLYDNAPILR
jgi:hypothetical protein